MVEVFFSSSSSSSLMHSVDREWLNNSRYSLFLVLYPVGIGGEWWLMFSAAQVASPVVAAVYYFCLVLYLPGE